MGADRTVQFKLLLSPDERQWLEEISVRKGLTVSDVIRQFIRDDHQKTGHAFTGHVDAYGVSGGRPKAIPAEERK